MRLPVKHQRESRRLRPFGRCLPRLEIIRGYCFSARGDISQCFLTAGQFIYSGLKPPNVELFGLVRGPVRVTTLRHEEKTMEAAELKVSDEPVFVEMIK